MKRFQNSSLPALALAFCVCLQQGHAAQSQPSGPKFNRATMADFKVIAERNIFNSKRYGKSSSTRRETSKSSRADTLVLTGTMTYEKGTFAFFDGSSSRYRKAVRTNDEIAGFKVAAVEPTSVLLSSGTNQLVLKVGNQLKRQEDGAWVPAGTAELAVSSSAAPTAPPPPQPASNQQQQYQPQGPPDFIRQVIENTIGRGGPPSPPPGVIVTPQQPGTTANGVAGAPGQAPASPGAASSGPQGQPAPASAAPESPSETLRRLMERRQQEQNQ